jgi:hypothetical protein
MHKTDAHPCPPMTNKIAPMPTQNPWAWVWAPNVGLWCIALVQSSMLVLSNILDVTLKVIYILHMWEGVHVDTMKTLIPTNERGVPVVSYKLAG